MCIESNKVSGTYQDASTTDEYVEVSCCSVLDKSRLQTGMRNSKKHSAANIHCLQMAQERRMEKISVAT